MEEHEKLIKEFEEMFDKSGKVLKEVEGLHREIDANLKKILRIKSEEAMVKKLDSPESGQAGRPSLRQEKFWNELSLLEKIERLREIIKSEQGEFRAIRQDIRALYEHKHLDGEIVASIYENKRGFVNSEATQRGPGKDDVYF